MNRAARQNALDGAESFVAILNKDGVMIGADRDADEAYEKAEHAAYAQGSPTGSVAVDSSVYAVPERQNPPTQALARAPAAALKMSRIRPDEITTDWSSFDPLSDGGKAVRSARAQLRARGKTLYGELLNDAHKMVHVTQKRGGVAAAFHDDWLTKDFLRQNMKMKKVLDTGDSYDSIGLSLLPHGASFRPPFSTDVDQGPQGASYCTFSTPECRKVCLVNTGQRALESGAFASSYLFSRLLRELRELPEQFLMNLFERCVLAWEQATEKDFYRFIRLNVLSDLPWEILAPGFFEAVANYARARQLGRKKWNWEKGLAFYDYTKIPYRRGVDGYYDLTMSFSGGRNLFPALFDILDNDRQSARRCAVVFVKREEDIVRGTGAPYRAAPGKPLMGTESWLPWTFLGERVWNGDLSDIRPLDPDEVKIVGLAYKVARYKVAPPRGSKKKYGLENVVSTADIDRELPTFLVRVMQPDPEAPPFVVATQDPDNRKLVLPIWDEASE